MHGFSPREPRRRGGEHPALRAVRRATHRITRARLTRPAVQPITGLYDFLDRGWSNTAKIIVVDVTRTVRLAVIVGLMAFFGPMIPGVGTTLDGPVPDVASTLTEPSPVG